MADEFKLKKEGRLELWGVLSCINVDFANSSMDDDEKAYINSSDSETHNEYDWINDIIKDLEKLRTNESLDQRKARRDLLTSLKELRDSFTDLKIFINSKDKAEGNDAYNYTDYKWKTTTNGLTPEKADQAQIFLDEYNKSTAYKFIHTPEMKALSTAVRSMRNAVYRLNEIARLENLTELKEEIISNRNKFEEGYPKLEEDAKKSNLSLENISGINDMFETAINNETQEIARNEKELEDNKKLLDQLKNPEKNLRSAKKEYLLLSTAIAAGKAAGPDVPADRLQHFKETLSKYYTDKDAMEKDIKAAGLELRYMGKTAAARKLNAASEKLELMQGNGEYKALRENKIKNLEDTIGKLQTLISRRQEKITNLKNTAENDKISDIAAQYKDLAITHKEITDSRDKFNVAQEILKDNFTTSFSTHFKALKAKMNTTKRTLHRNSGEFKAMGDRMDDFINGIGNNLETLNAIRKAAEDYISAKKSETMNVNSIMRNYRLAFAKELRDFAEDCIHTMQSINDLNTVVNIPEPIEESSFEYKVQHSKTANPADSRRHYQAILLGQDAAVTNAYTSYRDSVKVLNQPLKAADAPKKTADKKVEKVAAAPVK